MNESIVVLKEELAVFRILLGVLLLTGIGLIEHSNHVLSSFPRKQEFRNAL